MGKSPNQQSSWETNLILSHSVVRVQNEEKAINFTIKKNLTYCLNTGLKITSANWIAENQYWCSWKLNVATATGMNIPPSASLPVSSDFKATGRIN